MRQIRVTPQAAAQPDAFRTAIRMRMTGDARPRPKDCSGLRYLVRDEALPAFEALAQQFGLAVLPDSR